MKIKGTRIIGLIFLISGILIIFIPISGITGYVIDETSAKYLGYIAGLIFILVGIFFLIVAEKTKGLEERIGISPKSAEELSH